MRFTEIDNNIGALAAKQYGVFSRKQAFALGASDRFVQRRLAEKHWLKPVAAVYALANSSGTWKRQCKIAELSVEGSAIAGRTAAALHRLPGFRPGAVELVVSANNFCGHPWATLHRYSGATLTSVDGIAVTTIEQTLFDVSNRVSLWTIERTLDEAMLDKRLTLSELDERLHFYEGSRRPGLPRMRALITERREEGWVPPESELEALLHAALERVPSRPRVIRQASFPWRSDAPGRVDILLPDQRVIVEADGRRWHARYADFDRDRWRDNLATAHDHRVMRFTWVHLTQLVDDVVELINQAVTGRAVA